MNYQHAAAKIGLMAALILAAGMAAMARDGIAYLPQTGPPALRMLAVKKSPRPVPAMKIETPTKIAATDTNCPNIRALNTNTVETVVNSAGGYGSSFTGTMPPVVLGPGNPLDGAAIFTLPSQNTPGITPQILATYFQPTATDTNGAAVVVPFQVGFVPPVLQPDRSSHAEYIIK